MSHNGSHFRFLKMGKPWVNCLSQSKKSLILNAFSVLRLHCGDFGELNFTTLHSSTHPYFFALLLTIKLHISTYFFTQSVSIDVSCDVSDVHSIFLICPQYSIPQCGLQGVMPLQNNCPIPQTRTFSVPLLHRHRCSA